MTTFISLQIFYKILNPMRIEKCWFCSANIYPGHGSTYIRGDGSRFNFCSSKCRKLFMQRRNPRKVKWTKISRVLRNKDIVDDKVHKLEKRITIPVKCNQQIITQTVAAIPRILDLKNKKEDMFIKGRLLSAYEKQKKYNLKFIENHEKLLNKNEPETRIKKSKEKEAEYN